MPAPHQVVETARLRLHPPTAADLEDLSGLTSDPEVMRYLGKGVRTREETESALVAAIEHWERHGFGIWIVQDRENINFLGRCGLRYFQDTPDIELSYAFARPAWGRGIASEAAAASVKFGFEQLSLERIIAIAMPENTGSRRVMEKLGMHYEKNAQYFGFDHVLYAITRAEYRKIAEPRACGEDPGSPEARG
jgi:RimJ/RimL family protein N-acetyltransferase